MPCWLAAQLLIWGLGPAACAQNCPPRAILAPPQRFGYHDASCFGHALEGNLHLVFAQGFRTKEEVQRFSNLMEEVGGPHLDSAPGALRRMRKHRGPPKLLAVAPAHAQMCHIVANKHSGSLKGEHGTGRNVAPFVEMEWGTKAYDLMWELKGMFDPNFVLNPGECHDLTPFPAAEWPLLRLHAASQVHCVAVTLHPHPRAAALQA